MLIPSLSPSAQSQPSLSEILPPAISSLLVGVTAPTILEYCGVEAPEGLHGESLVNSVPEARTGIAGEFHSSNWAENAPIPLRMWRTKDAKYIESQCGDSEYYDFTADPEERNNLINDPRYKNQIAEMKKALYEWLDRTGDSWPNVAQPPEGFLKTRNR